MGPIRRGFIKLNEDVFVYQMEFENFTLYKEKEINRESLLLKLHT